MPASKGAKLPRANAAPLRHSLLPAGSAVRSGSRLAEVLKKIDDALAEGRLVPGQRLVEADLTAEFGASRSVIREALRLLAGEGVVELTPHRGCRIRRIDPQRVLYMREVYSILFRGSLEILVASPIGPAARAALKGALDEVVTTARSGTIRDKINATFNYHFTIAMNCGNPYFSEVFERLHIRHLVRQAEDESIHNEIDLIAVYKNATSRILKRDLAGARAYLNPMMARLEEHRRGQLESVKKGRNVLDLRAERRGD
jgi:DNA-binding GntR family transcriptional regulator